MQDVLLHMCSPQRDKVVPYGNPCILDAWLYDYCVSVFYATDNILQHYAPSTHDIPANDDEGEQHKHHSLPLGKDCIVCKMQYALDG